MIGFVAWRKFSFFKGLDCFGKFFWFDLVRLCPVRRTTWLHRRRVVDNWIYKAGVGIF